MNTRIEPGPWLRASALIASAGTVLAIVSGAGHLGTAHRLIAALVAPPLAALLVAAWLAHRALVPGVLAAAALFTAAAALPGRDAHAVFAALALAALLVVSVQSLRGEHVPWGSWRDYVALTKPRIMSLLLITGFCGMIAGARGWPGTGTAIAAMSGLALACGGASALNHVLDRDIDPLMGERTKKRPVASGRVAPSRALEFGLSLSAFSFVLLASTVNVLTAVLALIGNLFYVLVYTRWLKRTTSQNIVIGGAAGAAPPVLGWVAVTNSVDPNALLLFLIIFAWTPPHFWALAIARRHDYARADIPMLPVTHGVEFTRLHVLFYTVLLCVVTLLPYMTGMSGLVYLLAAAALNGRFLWLAVALKRTRRDELPMRMFRFSITYLMWLFLALLIDHYLPAALPATLG